MTDYPNKEHANADKAARRRALKALSDLIDEASLLKAGLEATDPPHNLFASDARRLAALSLSVSENLSIAETLRDVREWHEAGKAEAAMSAEMDKAEADENGVRSYSGQRSCLYCKHRARHDVAGFLACNNAEHITRALEAMTLAVAKQDGGQ